MPMRGFIELVEPREIRGWAYDSDRPDYPVKVVATVDDEELGTTVADISRADLGAANVGDGRHGFALVFQPPLLIDQLGKVEVAANSAEGVPAILRRTRFASDVMKSTQPIPWPSDPSQHPVFILGTTRSGTSAVSLALLKSGAYGGAGEGHVLELLGDLLD